MPDRLQEVNDAVRVQQEKGVAATGGFDPSTPWLALESNPAVLNTFAAKIGLRKGLEFIDVYAPELIPAGTVVHALVLLFPCTDSIYKFRREEEARLNSGNRDASKHLFFLEQVPEFGNACGTIACLHVLTNCKGCLGTGSALETFKGKHADTSPRDRGKRLLNEAALKDSSDGAADSDLAQTQTPSRDGPDLDHHFVAFVIVDGELWELDGTKFAPIHHGSTAQASFVEDAMRVVRTNFMALEPDLLDFSLQALASTP